MSGRYYSRRIGGKKEPFILRVDTTLGDGLNQMRLPIRGSDMKIDWRDGTFETVSQPDTPSSVNWVTHSYTTGGIYDIEMTNVDWIYFNNQGDRLKPTLLVQWGNYTFNTFISAFIGCENLVLTTTPTFSFQRSGAFTSGFQNIAPIPSLDADFLKNVKSDSIMSSLFRNTTISDGILPSGFLQYSNNYKRFNFSFENCGLTTVAPNLFDNQSTTSYNRIFTFNDLDQQSVDNILVSVAASSMAGNHTDSTRELSINGGTNATPSQLGKDATDYLRGIGWSVVLNGY